MGDWKAVVRYRKGNLEPGLGLGLGLGKGGVGGVVIVRDADDRMGGISVVRMGGGEGSDRGAMWFEMVVWDLGWG